MTDHPFRITTHRSLEDQRLRVLSQVLHHFKDSALAQLMEHLPSQELILRAPAEARRPAKLVSNNPTLILTAGERDSYRTLQLQKQLSSCQKFCTGPQGHKMSHSVPGREQINYHR